MQRSYKVDDPARENCVTRLQLAGRVTGLILKLHLEYSNW